MKMFNQIYAAIKKGNTLTKIKEITITQPIWIRLDVIFAAPKMVFLIYNILQAPMISAKIKNSKVTHRIVTEKISPKANR